MRSHIVTLALILIAVPSLATNPYNCSLSLAIGREASDCQNADAELFDLTAKDWNHYVCSDRSFTLASYSFHRDLSGGLQTKINGSTCIWETYYNP